MEKDDLVLTTGCGNPDVLAEMIVDVSIEKTADAC